MNKRMARLNKRLGGLVNPLPRYGKLTNAAFLLGFVVLIAGALTATIHARLVADKHSAHGTVISKKQSKTTLTPATPVQTPTVPINSSTSNHSVSSQPAQASTAPTPSTAQLNALGCSGLVTEEASFQGVLQNIYNDEVSGINSDIQKDSLETAPAAVALLVNPQIQSFNNVNQTNYQEDQGTLNAGATQYGCPTVNLIPEPTLPLYNPPATWNP